MVERKRNIPVIQCGGTVLSAVLVYQGVTVKQVRIIIVRTVGASHLCRHIGLGSRAQHSVTAGLVYE